MAAAMKRYTNSPGGSGDFVEPSNSKKCRFSEIPKIPEELVIKTATCMSELTDVRRTAYLLTPLQITNCNAAVPEEAFLFSNASCSVLPVGPMHVFGSVFGKGVQLLLNYLDEKVLPSNKQEIHLLSKLFYYLLDIDSHAVLEKSATFSETDTVLLANHLFAKLAASPTYTIDKHCKREQNTNACPCDNFVCTLSGQYGDTSLGHEAVWHGNVDIIINNDLVLECVEETDPDSPGGRSSVEVKLKSDNLERNPHLIAETIVFSFLKKQRHTESDHFLFPCVGVAGNNFVFYFYDSVNDVLLESSRIPLFIGKSGQRSVLNFSAVLACWLVVNYKYLCSGLTEGLLAPEKKAGFFSHARLNLPVYESALKLGNVGNPSRSKRACKSVDTTDEIILEAKDKIFKIQAKGRGCPAII